MGHIYQDTRSKKKNYRSFLGIGLKTALGAGSSGKEQVLLE